jgi:hypothetical protein
VRSVFAGRGLCVTGVEAGRLGFIVLSSDDVSIVA